MEQQAGQQPAPKLPSQPVPQPSGQQVEPPPSDRQGEPPVEPPVQPPAEPSRRGRRSLVSRYWWVTGLLITVVVVVLAGVFASQDPDGLQRVANDQGFAGSAQRTDFEILPGYSIPGLDASAGRIIAGIIGVAIVFAVVFVLGRVLARRRASRA